MTLLLKAEFSGVLAAAMPAHALLIGVVSLAQVALDPASPLPFFFLLTVVLAFLTAGVTPSVAFSLAVDSPRALRWRGGRDPMLLAGVGGGVGDAEDGAKSVSAGSASSCSLRRPQPLVFLFESAIALVLRLEEIGRWAVVRSSRGAKERSESSGRGLQVQSTLLPPTRSSCSWPGRRRVRSAGWAGCRSHSRRSPGWSCLKS